MAATPHNYSPLDSTKDEIRLLYIPNSKAGVDAIEYSLCHVSLHDEPDFIALSYCWGGQDLDRATLVDGQRTYITENLETALRNIRVEDTGVYLWADALCINQTDLVEKTWQVQLMRSIFRAATKVIIWLGTSTPETDYFFSGVRELGDVLIDIGFWELMLQKYDILVSWMAKDNKESDMTGTKDRIWKLMDVHLEEAMQGRHPLDWIANQLSDRSWFTRIWCIQECMNAQVATFRCGSAEADFKQIAVVRMYLIIFSMYLLGDLGHEFPARDLEPQANHQLQSRRRINLALSIRDFIPTKIIDLRMARLADSKQAGRDLRNYLDQTNIRNSPLDGKIEASNDVDRVYALLGIASDHAAAEIVPDYGLSCDEAYIKTARVLLKHGHDDTLSLCRVRGRIKDLPSWVPDWTAALRTPWSGFNPQHWSFHACGPLYQYVPIISSEKPDLLSHDISLQGVFVDSIQETGHVFSLPLEQKPLSGVLAGQWPFFFSISSFLAKSTRYSAEEKAQAEWKIPIGDGHKDNSISSWARAPADSHMKAGFERARMAHGWTESGVGDPGKSTKGYQCFIERLRRMYDSLPFITGTGHVGLCPKEAQPGDSLVIFMGVRVPYVIRPHPEGQRWTLIGETYVHGIMDGQFMENNPDVRSITLV